MPTVAHNQLSACVTSAPYEHGETWYSPLRILISRGSQVENVGGLAGIAEARREHEGQFFTPDRVVRFIWQLLAPVLTPARDFERISLFDSSFGSGRLFQYANPKLHLLYGIEKEPRCASAVGAIARAAGFGIHFEQGSMETFRASGMDVAIMNPPFSISFDSPLTESFACNTRGRFGQFSSCLSHVYAVAQALEAARIVAAIVPRGFANDVLSSSYFKPRLYRVFHLPSQSFAEEGTDWPMSLLVFQCSPIADELRKVITLSSWDDAASQTCDLTLPSWRSEPSLRHAGVTVGRPAILLPVTGDRRVRLVKNGRRLIPLFRCGLTQAMVLNRVYRSLVPDTRDDRYAPGVEFDGQGSLDLENYLFTKDPVASLQSFVSQISSWGFTPDVDPGVIGYLRRAHRRTERRAIPLRHVAYKSDGGLRDWLRTLSAPAAGRMRVEYRERCSWGSIGSPILAGTDVTVTRIVEQEREPSVFSGRRRPRKRSSWRKEPEGESVVFQVEPKIQTSQRWISVRLSLAEIVASIEFSNAAFLPEWKVIHSGLKEALPELYRAQEIKAKRQGIDVFLTWKFQFDDLVEMTMNRGAVICAWDMGLGKARLAVALCLMGGRRNLITVEARLVDEMRTELKGLPIPASSWQIITKASQLTDLRRINIISITLLKAPIAGGAVARSVPALAKRTFASELRHRIHTLIVDEAQMLRNPKTDQSRAVLCLSPKVVYDLSGTPIANYPRDILPLLQHVAGDGTAVQPYGLRHPFMHPWNLATMKASRHGLDVFADQFVTMEWVTNDFMEDGRTGAKREIPRIRDVTAFRSILAPRIKRRVMEEPEVAAHIQIPESKKIITTVEWDERHFAHYVAVVQEFKKWFDERKEYEGHKGKGLVMILAKIQAVIRAAAFPQGGSTGVPSYIGGLTSKQRHVLARLRELTAGGHKTICFAGSPDLLNLFADELNREGIESVLFHGGITLDRRVRDMDRRFRNGSAPILLASKGCLQTGYNLWQADRAIFADRDWGPRVEQQAAARLMRPQQKREVHFEFVHLAGSIDVYQDQMVRFKANAITAGLDLGDDETEGEHFQHLETILQRFIEDFEKSHGTVVKERRRA